MAIIQSVIYTPYPKNPHAAEKIVRMALNILGKIEGTKIQVGKVANSDRPMAIGNGCVVKTTTWENQHGKDYYFSHCVLREWCEFVLNGWKLKWSGFKGSCNVYNRRNELIDWVLLGHNTRPHLKMRQIVRDWDVPDQDVVWAGEQVICYCVEDGT
jgi:hypothetical protein